VELRQFAASGRGIVEGAVNVWNVLCSIARHKPTRVNVSTHATEGYIGLSGKVVKGNVIFNTTREENSLSPDIIAEADDEGFYFSDLRTKNATIKDVRDALGKHAEMVLYAQVRQANATAHGISAARSIQPARVSRSRMKT
jgi:hypothetical protein